jgi:hypothetical protein
MAFEAPVAVPDKTSREPSVEVMMLALTPGLLVAPLMAAAIPASVLSLEVIAMVADVPPTLIVKLPVPMVVLELVTGAEVRVAALARFCTANVYVPATASEDAVAVAMLVSPTVASNPARVLVLSTAARAVWRVSSELVNVPNAETWLSSEVSWLVSWFCCPAPKALVSSDTMAVMFRPEPMPVEVIAALPEDAVVAAAVLVVELVPDTAEVI